MIDLNTITDFATLAAHPIGTAFSDHGMTWILDGCHTSATHMAPGYELFHYCDFHNADPALGTSKKWFAMLPMISCSSHWVKQQVLAVIRRFQ